MTDRYELEHDHFDRRIAAAIRKSVQDGTFPTPDFLERCEQAGLRGLNRRRLRIAHAKKGDCAMPLSVYVEHLAHDAGISVDDAAAALHLPEAEGLQALNQFTTETRDAVLAIGIGVEVAKRAIVVGDQEALTIATRMAGFGYCVRQQPAVVCGKLDEIIEYVRRHGNSEVNAVLTARCKKAEELFANLE